MSSPSIDPLLPLLPWYSTGVEVGVARGVSARRFVDERCGFIVLVDPWCDYDGYPEQLGSDGAFEACMKTMQGYPQWLALRMKSTDAAAVLHLGREIDWVFIDANHTYDYVLADCRAWWPRIRPGGLLCGHDWNLTMWDSGVQRAVKTFAVEIKSDVQVHGNAIELGKNHQFQCWSIRK